MAEGFLMTAYTASIFFRYCVRYNITSKECKIKLLNALASKHKAMFCDDIETMSKTLRDKRN